MVVTRTLRAVIAFVLVVSLLVPAATAAPKVIVISLDGATPRLVDEYTAAGALDPATGLGRLRGTGIVAKQNETVSPSLTAAGHIAIATGSTAAHNDVPANTFHLVASPFSPPNQFTLGGFAAPIGGYSLTNHGPEESANPTANPLWLALRAAGKTVVTATFPGGDGLDVRVPGDAAATIVQPAAERTVDFTVPFGGFAGVGARGYALAAADFSPSPATAALLLAAGHPSFSPVVEKANLETFTAGGQTFTINVAAIDTTDNGAVDYDTLVFFDVAIGIPVGPFTPPATGPAYVKAADQRSSLFFLEGSNNQAGTSFYVSQLAPDLSTVRIARMSVNAIPRNAAVLGDVDDINSMVGFWAPQPDFRIPERLSPGFTTFPDLELEAIYADLVTSFVDYQTRVALRGIARFPDADLVMVYIEQPDGSGHQFLLTDPRQATNPADASTIGAGQDAAKIARYRGYLQRAYRVASNAVQRLIDVAGVDASGRPKSNVLAVSDHGFAIFHTVVNLNAYLASRGFDTAKVRAVTSGPAVNVYINLIGRELNGSVPPAEFVTLQAQVVQALADLRDTNTIYTNGAPSIAVFDQIHARPLPADPSDPSFGRATTALIGQDSGDVYALLTSGYNFDGVQTPVVIRQGDPSVATPVLSVPNFYGAHGYDPARPEMSAIFFAAGPDIRTGRLTRVRNIDVAPTVARLLGVELGPTVDGVALPVRIARKVKSELVARLGALVPSGDPQQERALAAAIERLGDSLADALWSDDTTLGEKGPQVFADDRAAIHALLKAGAEAAALARSVAAIDEELAAAAVDAALGAPADPRRLASAQAALTAGRAEAAAGDLEHAVDLYRKAWEEARRAIGHGA